MFKVPLDYQCAIVVHAVTRSASSCPAMLGRLQELQEEGQPAERGGYARLPIGHRITKGSVEFLPHTTHA